MPDDALLFGETAVNRGLITREQLEAALQRQSQVEGDAPLGSVLVEMGLITPPVGLNVFALSGVTGIPLHTVFRGVLPFVLAMVLCILLLIIFPDLSLFIPSRM